jgi:16S rRNA (adenine1518-N6/adenine1519-N6)-dimethyltransferase
MYLNGLKELKDDLARYEIRLKKNLGQNFLHDKRILERIITETDLDSTDWVLEIGAGIGCLTTMLAQKCHEVTAVEIDTNLRVLLQKNTEMFKNVKLVFNDILEHDMKSTKPTKVFGNLPYYCASAIIRQWSEQTPTAPAYFMLPSEIMDHISATPGTRNYTAFSVYAQYAFSARKLFEVHPSSFFPKPDIGSDFVEFISSKTKMLSREKEKHLFKVVEGAFHNRRKNLSNSLIEAGFDSDEVNSAIVFIGFDKNIRGEALNLEDFKQLAGFIPM